MKYLKLSILVLLTISFFSCEKEVGDYTVRGEAVKLFGLSIPEQNQLFMLNPETPDATLPFSWQATESGLGSEVKYTLVFDTKDGDFSKPIYSSLSKSEGKEAKALISYSEIENMVSSIGNAGDTVTVAWNVFAENGSENTVYSRSPFFIKIVRSTDGLGAFSLLTPMSNVFFAVDGSVEDQEKEFTWGVSSSASEADVVYKVLFDDVDGDFSVPILELTSDNDGLNAVISKSIKEWKNLFDENNIKEGAYKWMVKATSGDFMLVSEVNTMFVEFKNWANPIYIVGGATEPGWDINNAIEVAFVSPNVWTGVYTLKNGEDFKFFPEVGSWDNGIGADRFTTFYGCLSKDDGNFTVDTGSDGEFIVTVDLNSKTISVFEAPRLVGGSSVVDWNPANSYPLVRTAKGVFETYEYLTVNGSGVKLLIQEDWPGDFGVDGNNEGFLTQEGENNFSIDADGFYHIKVDFNDMSYKVTKVTWGIIGSGTPGGWGEDTNMIFSGTNKGDYTWTTDITLTDGEIKFRANDGWDINLGDNDADGSLEPGGSNLVATAGDYSIELVLNPVTGWAYSITAK